MKPVAIFRHAPTEGPGYLATFLSEHDIPWQLIKIDAGALVPGDVESYSGLVFMGGPMSVNDNLPWIPKITKLIQLSIAKNIPVLGHCLGGQLMSKSLGGTIKANTVKEIGWGEVTISNNPIARDWFGATTKTFLSFHWHGETFTIPPGATPILSSAYCENQAFAMGPHLGMQCHVEMTSAMIKSWCDVGARELAASTSPSVQAVNQIQHQLEQRVSALNRIAATLYNRWIKGLRA